MKVEAFDLNNGDLVNTSSLVCNIHPLLEVTAVSVILASEAIVASKFFISHLFDIFLWGLSKRYWSKISRHEEIVGCILTILCLWLIKMTSDK